MFCISISVYLINLWQFYNFVYFIAAFRMIRMHKRNQTVHTAVKKKTFQIDMSEICKLSTESKSNSFKQNFV